MVKSFPMLISEFARACGLTTDTVRFYVRRGLLTPETGARGGSNPYQIFTATDVDTARAIRLAQSLGFSLREIAALAAEYRSGSPAPDRAAQILQDQLARLEEKAAHLARMIAFMRAKRAHILAGGTGPAPRLAPDGAPETALSPLAAAAPLA